MKNAFFIIGLILILASFFLLIEFSDSQRMNLIAGVILIVGLAFNAGCFALKHKIQKK